MMIRGYEIGARVIAIAVAAAVVIALVLAGLHGCQSAKVEGKKADIAEGQAGAAIDSGAEAMNTASNVAEADKATDAAVAQGQAEIAKAAKGQKGAAAKRAACRLKAYADTPQCKEPTQ